MESGGDLVVIVQICEVIFTCYLLLLGSYGNRHPEEFGNRYSWHNPDYPRRPSIDEER